MNNAELQRNLRMFDDDVEITVVFKDDDSVYNEVLSIEDNGTGIVEITVV